MAAITGFKINDENARVLYNHAYEETKHYRSFEWQITFWAVSLIGVIISFTQLYALNPAAQCLFQSMFSYFTVFCAGFAVYNIIHCHKGLTSNRIILWKLEQYFLFYSEYSVDGKKTYLILPKYDREPPFLRGQFQLYIWFTIIISLTFFALYCIYTWQCK